MESANHQMTTPNLKVASLHACYVQYTGLQLPLNRLFAHEYAWGSWMVNGWTESDLRLVVSHVKREHPKFALKMLRFSRLIEDHQNFSELLAEAKASQRNHRPQPSAKAIVLREAHRELPETQDGAKQAGAIAQEILDAGYERMRKATE